MDISLKWLNKFLDLSEYSPEELADKITVGGVEVESIKYLAQGTNLVIGEVLECEAHPNSDHLHVCKVDLGKEITQIVCGAPNVSKGQKVIVSKPGAILPAKGLTIQKGVIRGVESNGMICSLLELGVDKKFLSEEQQAGIEVLDKDAPVGDENPLGYLGLDDVIFELKPTPNRGDVLSMLSFAYEVGAILDKKVKHDFDIQLPKLEKTVYTVSSNTPKCPVFSIKGVKGVKVKEGPKWMSDILRSAGIRSINNIVDIGNYVMLLLGQPLHMYDAHKLENNNFVVKDDLEGDFKALDEQTYNLKQGDLVVTNGNDFSCLAGVMGASSTMVDDKTTDLAIEAALFNSTSVRRTSQRLQLISDSSTYFVRGVDESRGPLALDLAASLLVQYADAKVVMETVTYGNPYLERESILLTTSKVNAVLGTSFTSEQIADVFRRLSFKYEQEGESFKVVPPTYRKDIVIAEDLIEEVIRLLGFDNLVSTYPLTANVGFLTPKQKKKNLIRNHFLDNGLDEALSYTLVSSKYINDFVVLDTSKGEAIKLLHPMTEDKALVRRSLIPSLLLAVNYNHYHKEDDVAFFEISKIYTEGKEGEHLGVVLSGTKTDLSWKKEGKKPVDYYQMKGLITGLFKRLGIEPTRYQLVRIGNDTKDYHFGRTALIKTGNKVWGVIGEIHPEMVKKYDVPRTVVAELDLEYLYELKTSTTKFAAPSLYPSISRDIAIVVKENINYQDITKTIKKAGKALVSSCEVFDVYQGEHIAEGFKSIAIRITYLDSSKTLKDEEVNLVHNQVVSALSKELGAQLR